MTGPVSEDFAAIKQRWKEIRDDKWREIGGTPLPIDDVPHRKGWVNPDPAEQQPTGPDPNAGGFKTPSGQPYEPSLDDLGYLG